MYKTNKFDINNSIFVDRQTVTNFDCIIESKASEANTLLCLH